jgi:hypothetical protein
VVKNDFLLHISIVRLQLRWSRRKNSPRISVDKDPKFADAQMMRLEDLFREYGRAFRYHVELTSGQADLPAAVAKVIEKYHMEYNVVFTSGRPTMLQAVKELAPEIPRAYLARYADERVLRIAACLEVEQLCPRADLITPELV